MSGRRQPAHGRHLIRTQRRHGRARYGHDGYGFADGVEDFEDGALLAAGGMRHDIDQDSDIAGPQVRAWDIVQEGYLFAQIKRCKVGHLKEGMSTGKPTRMMKRANA